MAQQLQIQPVFPAQVIGISPIIISKSGLTYTFSFNALGTQLSVVQAKRELVTLGFFDVAAAAIPGDPKDPVNMAWMGGGVTQPTGPLMTAIFSAIGYATQPQKDAFIAAALLFSY